MDFSKKYDISVYLTEEQLNKRIAEIGAQITEKYRGQSVDGARGRCELQPFRILDYVA